MDDIARELGILKGSLYYWIDSKEALLQEVLAGGVRETIAEAMAIADLDLPASERLSRMVRSHIDSWLNNPDHFNVFLSEWRWLEPEHLESYHHDKDQLEETYRRVIRDGIASGEFKADAREVSVLVNGIFGVMNWFPRWYREGGWATPHQIADMLSGMVINGLRGRHPIAASER
ncbi:MAG: TetR/AcrR family transcriptional regulator [Hyphomicrobiales bacterium]